MKSFSFVKLLNAMVNPGDAASPEGRGRGIVGCRKRQQSRRVCYPAVSCGKFGSSKRVGVRVLSTAAASGAGVVQTDVNGSDILRRFTCLAQNYGLQRARIYTGLQGNVEIPTESNTITAGWVDETAVAAEKDPTIGKITLKPKRLGTSCRCESSALLTMGNPDVEDLVKFLTVKGGVAMRLIQPYSTEAAQHLSRLG